MKRRAALVMLTAMTFVANLQWVHAAGGTMAYRMAEPKTQKGAASHGVVLELVDRGTLTPEERKQMLRTPDGVESGRQPTVWETAPNGEKLPAKCNRYDELSAGELALWRLIQLADGRHRLMARRVRGEPHIPNIEPQGHFGELVGDIIRVLESAHTEVAKQGNRINPALLDNVQRVVMQAAIIYYASAHSKGEIVGILTGNHIRALNRYCKMVERWGLDAIGMWGDVTDHPLERLSEYLDVPRWNGGTLRVPVPAAALMLISRSEDVMKKLSIEERTKITLNARLWDSDVGLGESDIAILCRNCRRALEMIRKLKYQICAHSSNRNTDGEPLLMSCELVERRNASQPQINKLSRHDLIRELSGIQMRPGQVLRELTRRALHIALTNPEKTPRNCCEEAEAGLRQDMPNSSGKIMRNKLLTEKMRGQSIAMVSALVNANMVRLEEQADVWRQGAPDIKAVEIVVPQKLRAVTPDDSTEVQAMWLQEQVTGAAILEGIELGGAGKLVSKMSLGGEYPESVDSVEQPWRIQVGEELKCVRKFGHSWKTEAGHRKGAVEWNVGTYKLQVLAEVERQLIGVGASELARRLTEACGERRKHDGVLPFKENVLYEAKALGVDCAAMREIIELAEVGMFYGAQIRDAIRVLEIKAEVVAGGIYGMAEELKNGGHTQAADGVRAVGQSLGQWSKSKPSERVKMDQHMQYIELISELEGIVNQARIAEATFRGSVKRLPGVGEIRGILRNCRKWSGLARAYERELAGRKDTAARLRARLEEAERARAESS